MSQIAAHITCIVQEGTIASNFVEIRYFSEAIPRGATVLITIKAFTREQHVFFFQQSKCFA